MEKGQFGPLVAARVATGVKLKLGGSQHDTGIDCLQLGDVYQSIGR